MSTDLRKLFDYQRFEREKDLQTIIHRVERKYELNSNEDGEEPVEEEMDYREAHGNKITDIRTAKNAGRKANRWIPFANRNRGDSSEWHPDQE